MAQVIICQNENGGVSLTLPTGELSIEEVLAKDCPPGSIIVDESTLPQGIDDEYFNAWELNGNSITVNLEKARAIKLMYFNAEAVVLAQKRQLNELAGIANEMTTEEFTQMLADGRSAISVANSTQELSAIVNPK